MTRVLEDRDRVLLGRENSVCPQPTASAFKYCPEVRAVRCRRRCQARYGLSGWRQIARGLEYPLKCRASCHAVLRLGRRASRAASRLGATPVKRWPRIPQARLPSVPKALGRERSKDDGRPCRIDAASMSTIPILTPAPANPRSTQASPSIASAAALRGACVGRGSVCHAFVSPPINEPTGNDWWEGRRRPPRSLPPQTLGDVPERLRPCFFPHQGMLKPGPF